MSIETKDIVGFCKQQPVLSVCCSIILALSMWLYFRMDLIDEVQTQIDSVSKIQQKLSANVRNGVKLDEHTQALQAANSYLRSRAFKQDDPTGSHQVLFSIESDAGVKLSEYKLTPVPPASKTSPSGSYIPINYSLAATGTYRELMYFLKIIESNRVLANIISASASFSSDAEAEQTLRVTVDFLGIRK